jgi:TonB family protein
MQATIHQKISRLVILTFCFFLAGPIAFSQTRVRLAVLDFGQSRTGLKAADRIRELLRSAVPGGDLHFDVTDPDLARTAAAGAGFKGSLNLTLQEARDYGAAIGCDYYFIGDGQTFKRSPSEDPVYYESYASIFLVSARTGKLLLWERPIVKRDSADQAENALLALLSSDETRRRYALVVRAAQESERQERIAAVEAPARIIEVMSDEDSAADQSVRAPRPYRRLKPAYPESAASAEAEAIVDVLVDIDARGEIDHIEIARWAGYGLDQSVLETVKQMHFFPAQREGLAIPMRVMLRYNFRKPPPVKRSS